MVEGKPVWPLLGGKDAYAGRALVYASTGEVHPPDWRAEEVLQIEYPYEPPGWIPEARDGLLAEPIRID